MRMPMFKVTGRTGLQDRNSYRNTVNVNRRSRTDVLDVRASNFTLEDRRPAMTGVAEAMQENQLQMMERLRWMNKAKRTVAE